MAKKWNLQDIRPAGAPKPSLPKEPLTRRVHQDIAVRPPKASSSETFEDPDLATIDIVDGNNARRRRVAMTSIIAIAIIVLGFLANILLRGADVTVYPKLRDVFVQANFTAFTNPKVGDLGYELLTLEATGERQVKAAGKEVVSLRAEGKIVVYNTKSTAPQRLIKNTRFENGDGLIFRIKESIEVPGVTKDSKGNPVPGTVVASVFADGTGEQYNLPPSRFTVPGLKGTDQYDSVYGESTVAFTGGFEGEKYLIDEAELSTAKQALQIELRDKLLARLNEERPAGFILYDNAVTFTFDSLPSTEYGDSLATIKERARLQVPLFNESEFAEFIANKSVPDYAGDPVQIPNPETLTFSYQSATTTITDISTFDSIEFLLKGNARIIWTFDENALKSELISIEKNEAAAVFSSYPSISNAQAEVRPFWESSFPDSPDHIKIHTVIEG
jgi:hypothetical protein